MTTFVFFPFCSFPIHINNDNIVKIKFNIEIEVLAKNIILYIDCINFALAGII